MKKNTLPNTGRNPLLIVILLTLIVSCAAPVSPTAAPPTAASATQVASTPTGVSPTQVVAPPTSAPQTGASLIGKLEGPEIVTDASKFPKAFKEAPQLAELVKQGKLVPVAERVGQDPLVVKPLSEIGKYGGTLRRAFTGPGDKFNGYRMASGRDTILAWGGSGNTIVPNIAKGWQVSDGGRVTTVFLRSGMKWSDGQPFTADDFMFWYEDMYQNKELVPTPAVVMTINTKPIAIEKVDTYTIRFRAPDPYPLLPEILAGSSLLGGQANRGLDGMGAYAPAHYLKQFHPKYASKEELEQKAKDAKFNNWATYFKFKNDWALNPELPVVSPWKTTSPANTPTWTLERNPYSVWVDTEGNQLPYLDKITMTLAENLEIVNLRAIAGEYDFQERHLDISKLPVFLSNQQRGNYKVYLDTAEYGSDMEIKFNLSYAEDPEIAKWISEPDFRRALSLGIDRDQLNESFWLGTGTPGSVVPAASNPLNPGSEYRKLWATYDPDKANAMLDKLGLDKKDSAGYRLRTDGKGRLTLQVMTLGGQFLPFTQIMEAIKPQWKKTGIDINVQEIERSLAVQRSAANQHQMCAWINDGSDHLWTAPDHVFPFAVSQTCGGGPLYAQWLITSGQQGKEPPARVRQIMDNYRKAFGVSDAERIQLGKEIWKIAAEDVIAIGVVGIGPASSGVRIVNVNLGNIPARIYNSPDVGSPSIAQPVTFYWKK